MLAPYVTDHDDPLDPTRGIPAALAAAWRPAGVDEALVMLDRIARHCSFSCTPDSERCTEACGAWTLERAATAYLAGRWADGQD